VSDEQQAIEAATRKMAGISALRRLHKLVVEDREQRVFDQRWARGVLLLASGAGVLFLIWVGLHFTR
jgi:hypothetical protein